MTWWCRYLNVSYSVVSDDGIRSLCGISDHPDAKGCKQLESLYVRSTQITEEGIRFAIQFLEKLKYVDSRHLSNANLQLQSNRVLPPTTSLKSCLFTSDGCFHFEFLVESEEHLKETVIWNTGSTDNWGLMGDATTEIGFQQDVIRGSSTASFPDKIVPFLNRFGRGIHKLKLNSIGQVDVFSLMSICPLIRRFIFFFCNFKVSSVPRPPISHHLESIEILCDNKTLGHEELVYLLMSPNVREISIVFCHALCDDVLETAFRHHRFNKLERLSIVNCERVSKRTFTSYFMSESNALKFIEIKNCKFLSTLDNQLEWLSLAASRNWDLKIVLR